MDAHVALIVEDDPHIADVLKELVGSLGHAWKHAATLDEARAAIDRGGYCYVLLDMQIPADATSRPMVGCGETALAHVRKRDARRNAAGRHVLPVLVVTSYSRDPDFVSRMHDMDADGFIAKPFGDRIEAVLDKIRTCLARAERVEHAACDGAVATAPVAASPIASSDAMVTIEVDGARSRRRTGFLIGGARCELQDARFAVFLRLVAALVRSPGAWSSRHQLGITRSKETPSRIRTALAPFVPPDFDVLEWDRVDSFRLNPGIRVTRVDWTSLEKHPEPSVQKAARARGRLASVGALRDSAAPRHDSAAPRRDSAAPLHDSAAPLRDSAAPLRDSAAPLHDSAAPLRDSAAPLHDSAGPLHDSAGPLHDSAGPLASSGALTAR